MAFDWGTGFELNSLSIEIGTVSGSPTTQTTVKRSGAYAMKTASLSSGAAQGVRLGIAGGAGPFFFQTALCLETAPGVNNRIMVWNDGDGFTTPLFWLTLKTDRTLQFSDEDGDIGSPSSALTADASTWYVIEVKYDITGGAGAGILEAKLNGTSFASSTTRSISANVSFWGWGGNLALEANTTGIWYFDDIIFNNSTGSYMNSYADGAKIIHLRPDGAGDNSAWTGSFADIDEITPDDATTFIAEGPAADIIDVTLAATPSELGSGDTVKGVFIGHRATLSSAAGSDPRYVLRLKASPGGTTDETGAQIPNVTTWYTNANTNRSYITGTTGTLAVGNSSNYEQPGGSSAWTKSALDTAQIGARISSTEADSVRITAMWLLVLFVVASGTEYTQDASGGITPSGAILKESRKVLAGTLTDSGAVNKSTSKTFAGSLSSIVGTLAKQADKVLSGVLSSIVGTLTVAKTTAVALSGAITPSGTLSRLIDKILGSTLTSSGSVEKQTTKSFTGDVTPTGGLLKQINKTLSGAITSIVGTLEKIKLSLISLGGSLEPTGTITKQTNKTLSGDNTPQGSLLKSISKSLSGTVTSAGELLKSFIKTLSGDITPQGSIVKSTNKSFAGDVTPTGTATKQSYRVLEGSITPTGSVLKSISKFLAGVLTWAGDLIADYIPAGGNTFFKTLTGELTSSGTVQKSISKAFAGTMASAGALLKSITKTFSGILVPTGEILKSVSKFFSGTLTSSGTLDRSITFGKILDGTLASAGTLVKSTAKSFSGVLTPDGSVIKAISKFFSGTLNLSGTLEKGVAFLVDLAGSIAPSGNLFRRTEKSLAGNLTSESSISKAIGKSLSGNLSFIGQVTKSISKFFSGLLSSSGILTRIFNLPPTTVPKIYLRGSRELYEYFEGEMDIIIVELSGRRELYENLTGSK